ncbi:type IV pilus twitching motility protein PilT [Calditerrivibrio nitroreducens]|uniref:Pilus retraction ATPase PilT n=1 Tax=Calditerrivibrio nitroreducens (strain DSM 19672 / NBRC 101217 / Yu37-1) TaxID=768670 RepID=E4TIY3_CALNY|nr:type IV pilus twitching motility protein PilT [Calditerrivibrio nitroreducens]ADR19115.1 pilus retraction ATPase PilT [Calditerrivibrio nitroreducens DSM 19672]
MAKIDAFFKYMMENNCSDLHLSSGCKPMVRKHGELEEIKYQELTNEILEKLLFEIITDEQRDFFLKKKDLDFAYEIPGMARFRANYFYQKRGIAAVFRIIPSKILTAEELGLPPQVLKFANLSRGLVLVTGPTGSGKSTTLAAIIDYINRNRKDHILTIEDPVEFVHESKGCLVNHREVGSMTQSFSAALRAALREDPDVILVGEMRDLETIELAITAAETGHLVFGTLHTNSAPKTVDRIIDAFPAGQQAQIRTMLSESLKGVISQQLLKRSDKPGRVAALEIMVVNSAIANLIREGKIFQIPSIMQTGKADGMQMMDQVILDFLMNKVISPEEAYLKANDKKMFEKFLQQKQ